MKPENSYSVTPDNPKYIPRRKMTIRNNDNHRKMTHETTTQEEFSETSETELQSESQQTTNGQESHSEENTSNPDIESETVEKSQEPTTSVNSANSPGSPTPIQNQQHPDSYLNIAPLPIFKGESNECAVTHLSRFTKVCRANNASSLELMARIFPVTLEGEAALWYELNIDPNRELTWEEIRTEFLKVYRDESFDPFRSELLTIQQGERESVNSFYMRMRWALKKWPDLGFSDLFLKGVFIDGLREDFQDWVIARNPNSLEEARKFAKDWEQAEIYKASRRKIAGKSSSGEMGEGKGGFCEEKRCELRGKMRGLRVNGGLVGELGLDGKWLGRDGKVVYSPVMSRSGGEGGGVGSSRRSGCQCSKHGCWKKILRSNTFPN